MNTKTNKRSLKALLAGLMTVLMMVTCAAPAFACTEELLNLLGISVSVENGNSNTGNSGNTGNTNTNTTGGAGYVDVSYEYTAINNFRQEKGVWYWNEDNKTKTTFNTNSSDKLGTLARDTALEETAKVRAKEIATQFSHTRPNGQSCFTAYPNYSALGENIAYGQRSVDEVMTAFKEENDKYNGQGHRRNLLNKNFNVVGVACYRDKNGTLYWAQCFGRK